MQTLIRRNRVVLLHLSFWCVYLSFFVYRISSFQRGPDIDWPRVLTIAGVQVSFAMIIGYLNYFYLLPKFLEHKNGWRYFVQFAISFAVLITIRIYLERFILRQFSSPDEYLYDTRFLVQVITTNLFIVIFLGMIRFAVDWFEFEAHKKNVENEKLTAELNFLKAQINPHFLFNTLNNLYYLAYSKSPNTPEVIAKLSQMMRYMIYDSNYPQVPLSKEIEYMENYISLERLRLNEQIPINFKIEGDPKNYMITPLIFITFLENAFKHGVVNNNPKAWVNLTIKLNDHECVYTVENSRIPTVKPESEEKSGIGLQNVKRRLELSYPDRYELETRELADKYQVKVKIILS
jgi:two-component system, LytTR family, sensor histidine kinase AlgZ